MMRPLTGLFLLRYTLYIVGIVMIGYVGYVTHDVSEWVKLQEQQRTWAVQTCQQTLTGTLEKLNRKINEVATSTVEKLEKPKVYAPILQSTQYP